MLCGHGFAFNSTRVKGYIHVMKDNPENMKLRLLAANLPPIMVKDPMFMFYCPLKINRDSFINKYFRYFLPKWIARDELLSSESGKTAATLINPDTYPHKFSGQHGFSMMRDKNSSHILLHRRVITDIIDVILPERMQKKVLTMYADPENSDEIAQLIDEAKKKAEEENFVVVYETLSKTLLPIFERKGFEIAYERQFMNTQFFQTVMVYNAE